MPLRKVSPKKSKKVKKAVLTQNFHKLRHEPTFARTRRKFGVVTARKQMQARALNASGYGKKTKKKGKR